MTCQLDPIRDDIIAWSESLWLEGASAFRNGDDTDPHLPSTLFMAYILYTVNGLDQAHIDRRGWAAWVQTQQNPQNGSFAFPPPLGSSIPRKGIALWNAVRVLGILDAELLHYPEYQRNAHSIDGLRDWFETWEALGDSHHEVLALAPTLASHPDSAWQDAYFKELVTQQHPNLGTWPRGEKPPNISRTFAYSLAHLGMDRIPPQPDRIIDAMIDLQDPNGLWHKGVGFSTMDAVYLLLRLPEKTDHRQADAAAALTKTADTVIAQFEAGDVDRSDTHKFAAPVQTLALLSQALPDRFTASHTWRFAWENREFWYSQTIANELASPNV